MRGDRRKRLALAATLLGALVLGGSLFRGLGRLLVRDDEAAPGAPYIALLIGDATAVRVERARQLLAASDKSILLLAREEKNEFVEMGLSRAQADLYREYLLRHGVSEERIVPIEGCWNSSTWEEVSCLRRHLESAGPLPKRLPIVTSWFHTSRAGWLAERAFRDTGVAIEMVPAYGPRDDPSRWWSEEAPFLAVVSEAVKWTYWVVIKAATL